MLKLTSHQEELVIDLGFFNSRLHTGCWGDAAHLAAPPVQDDVNWGKQRQELTRIIEYPELEGAPKDH
ncbi:hypothetical protein WISP_53401 [Willisornis vidua]|uniref:Transposase n=1 Tax=Willisornis vidua TaxID=1566151 RepID=A0ABQ9DD24_9PASS|nr:hypothetical protein WISP_53401 [Willisornis vidua]